MGQQRINDEDLDVCYAAITDQSILTNKLKLIFTDKNEEKTD